jgi:hypothetical protein
MILNILLSRVSNDPIRDPAGVQCPNTTPVGFQRLDTHCDKVGIFPAKMRDTCLLVFENQRRKKLQMGK